MLDLTYHMPTKMIYGPDCVKKNAALFPAYGKKCMIVSGKHSAKASGALDDVLAALKEYDIEWIQFDEVEQNPLLSTCKALTLSSESAGVPRLTRRRRLAFLQSMTFRTRKSIPAAIRMIIFPSC